MNSWRVIGRVTPMFVSAVTQITAVLAFLLIGNSVRVDAVEVTPDQLEFRRQAVRRMIFDRAQDIPRSGLWPAKVVGLDVMHPAVSEQLNDPRLEIKNGRLRISGQNATTATRWIGGFNPFAVYDVAVNKFNGSGQIGAMFRDTDAENYITTTLVVDNGKYRSIRCVIVKDGKDVRIIFHPGSFSETIDRLME